MEQAEVEWLQPRLLSRVLVALMQLYYPIRLAVVRDNSLVPLIFLLGLADVRPESLVGVGIEFEFGVLELEVDLLVDEDPLVLHEIQQALGLLVLDDHGLIQEDLLAVLLIGVVGLDLEDGLG